MDKEMIAYCGTYCGACKWREKTGCKGCKANAGVMFWGECDKAKCCIEKGYEHCGECPELPCEKIQALIDDPEHGDNGRDVRLRNLRNWKAGNYVFCELENAAQEQAGNMDTAL